MPAALWCADFARDLGYAARTLARSPGFAVTAVLTISLGIGATTAIFSAADSILLRPLPYREPARLMTAGEIFDQGSGTGGFSAGSLLDWRESSRSFEGPAGWSARGFNLAGQDGLPERVEGLLVTWDFFRVLGVPPLLGRGFLEADGKPGAPPVAVLSYALWQRRFAGSRSVLGQVVIADGRPCVITGVMPRTFRFFYGPEMWMPLTLDRASADRTAYFLAGVARLKPGTSIEAAAAESDRIAQTIERPNKRQWSGRIAPLGDAFVAVQERRRLLLLLGAAGFVLLIACANAGSLLLARGAARRQELAVRSALGAAGGRLMRQLLAESILLASAGGVLGVLLAAGAARLLRSLVSPLLLAGRPEIALDARVLAFALGLSVFTGIAFGLVPAWRARRVDLQQTLQEASRGASAGAVRSRIQDGLVVAEVACSVVLLASAGLLLRSFAAMHEVDLGFRRDHVLTMQLAMSPTRFASSGQMRSFYAQVLRKVSSIPTVHAAGLSMGQAPWDTPDATALLIAGQPAPPPSQMMAAALERVSTDYFRVMGIRLLQGRTFTDRDDERAQPVALVNQAFVALYLSGKMPLGQKVVLGERAPEIVGVAADVKFGGPQANPVPMIYLPILQAPQAGAALALHTWSEPTRLAQTVRAALAQIDAETPAARIRTLEQIAAQSMAQPRLHAGLMSAFAGIALLLAGLGIYGVTSYRVAQNTRTIGIRTALGATKGDIVRLMAGRSMLLASVGLLAGAAIALALTRLLASLLFHVAPADPATFAGVALLLMAVAALAAAVPARRAASADPLAALRAE